MPHHHHRAEPWTISKRLQLAALLALGTAPFFVNGLYNPLLAATPSLFWLADLGAFVVLPITIYLVARRLGLVNARELGLIPDIKGERNFFRFFLALLFMPFILWWSYAGFQDWGIYLPIGMETKFSYRDLLRDTFSLRPVFVIYMSITAGVVEEIYYRGMMKRIFDGRWWSVALFVPFSSVYFALVHWETGGANTAGAFGFGLAAALGYLACRNLWPLIIGHFLVDYFFFS